MIRIFFSLPNTIAVVFSYSIRQIDYNRNAIVIKFIIM